MQRKLFIAVMVLGIASLIYWALKIKDYETPATDSSQTELNQNK